MKKPTRMKYGAGAAGLLDIATRLRGQVEKVDAGPSWQDRSIAAMSTDDKESGIIKCLQIQREGGAYDRDPEVFFAMMAQATNPEADKRMYDDAEIKRIHEASHAVNKAHGLEPDEYFPIEERPDDVKALDDAFERRLHEIHADVLREHGETDMADLLLNDPDAFHRRCDAGREMWNKSEATGFDK
jgi:hypothetical protein